ncbi:hypothetical protein [Paucihalobacter sp.]|uniref:hypothetical protein n=1 Tax=Paucihalobacter sp. TaxID=2850405 RepID=UPI002FDF2373
MNYKRKKFILKQYINQSCLLWLFMLFYFNSFGQSINQFKIDNYNINDSIKGVLNYEYYLKNKDTVLSGKFNFQSTKETENSNYQYETLGFLGDYQNNNRTGNWQFVQKRLNTSNQTQISNYDVLVSTNGIEHQVNAKFNNGTAEGNWSVVNLNFANSIPKDTVFQTYASFKGDNMVGNLQALSEDFKIRGSFNSEGLLDGDWLIVHNYSDQKIEEIKRFENGIFKGNFFKINGKTFEVVYEGFATEFDSDKEAWVEIGLRDGYFDIFNINIKKIKEKNFPSNINFEEITNQSNEFMEHVLLSFGYYNNLDLWSTIPGKNNIRFGKFKVKKFAYSEADSVALQNIKKKYNVIVESINSFFINKKLKASMASNLQLNRINAILKVYKDESNQFEDLLSKVVDDAFQYVDRSIIINQIYPKINFSSSGIYQFQDQQINLDRNFPAVSEGSNFSLTDVSDLVDAVYDDVQRQNGLLNIILSESQKQEFLSDFENELFANKEKIISSFSISNQSDDYNSYHFNMSEEVIRFTNNLIADYTNLTIDDKKITIETYNTCLNQLSFLWDELVEFDKKAKRLDEEYTRISFNPFLMADISERLKERVYRAYEEHLLPYALNDIKDNLSCETLEGKIENLDMIYNRMMNIRDNDTKFEEANLRREKDVEKIMEVLKLNLN